MGHAQQATEAASREVTGGEALRKPGWCARLADVRGRRGSWQRVAAFWEMCRPDLKQGSETNNNRQHALRIILDIAGYRDCIVVESDNRGDILLIVSSIS